jgi:hypothetical protein
VVSDLRDWERIADLDVSRAGPPTASLEALLRYKALRRSLRPVSCDGLVHLLLIVDLTPPQLLPLGLERWCAFLSLRPSLSLTPSFRSRSQQPSPVPPLRLYPRHRSHHLHPTRNRLYVSFFSRPSRPNADLGAPTRRLLRPPFTSYFHSRLTSNPRNHLHYSRAPVHRRHSRHFRPLYRPLGDPSTLVDPNPPRRSTLADLSADDHP